MNKPNFYVYSTLPFLLHCEFTAYFLPVFMLLGAELCYT
jgi:hypothetical protein